MKLLLLITLLSGGMLSPTAVQAQSKSITTRIVNTNIIKGEANFVGPCTELLITTVCPSAKPVTGIVSIGSTVHGMNVGSIYCEMQDKTYRGWRGEPDYMAFKGLYNCKAAPSTRAAQASSKNATRPWIYMVGVRF